MDEQLKPAIASESGLEYSRSGVVSAGSEATLNAVREAALDLGLRFKQQTDARLSFREQIHGLSWPIRVEVLARP